MPEPQNTLSFKGLLDNLIAVSKALVGNDNLTGPEKLAVVKEKARTALKNTFELGEDAIALVVPPGFRPIFAFITDNGPIESWESEAADFMASAFAEFAYQVVKNAKDWVAKIP